MKFTSHAKNLAVKKGFYDNGYEELEFIEKTLSKLESNHSNSIKKLLNVKNYYKLNEKEQFHICEFFALQYIRTENHRRDINHTCKSTLDIISNKKTPPDLLDRLSKNMTFDLHLNMIKDYSKYALLFFNMKMIIFENYTSIPFWTSDSPITKQNEIDKHPLGNLGIVNRGIEIHLPLTPKIMIIALDPVTFELLPNKKDGYKKDEIIRENFLQLKFSSRFVFSNTRRFHLIHSMLKDNSHFREGHPNSIILNGQSKNSGIIIQTERNDRWPMSTNPVMGKLETWIDYKIVDEILNPENK